MTASPRAPHPAAAPPSPPRGDLPLAELDVHGRAALAWIEQYLAHPERYPVLSPVAPGEIAARLPAEPPVAAESLGDILHDFETQIVPGITHWNHPAFFGYFATSSSTPAIIAEMLAAALDVKAMLWRTSPAATELEQVVTGWLRRMLGLGHGWFGLLTDTASISSMLALAAAREAHPELEIRARGMAGRAELPVLRVYTSALAHSSIDKAALALGLGLENVVHVPVDEQFRMDARALQRAIDADRRRGCLPLACVATVGTTGVASIDPVPAIAGICRHEALWLHVDAAYGGVAAIVPEMRGVLAGVDAADSLVVNPHKWLFTPFDCSAFYTRKPEILERAFSLVPEYLTTPGDDHGVDFMNYGVQLGRRFRALKLWMVIRAFGTAGLAERIRAHCALARDLADRVGATPNWVVAAPVHLSLVCLRHAPPGLSDEAVDAHNERIMTRVNATGEAFLSHTRIDGRYVIRFAIGNLRTEERHVWRAWELLREMAGGS